MDLTDPASLFTGLILGLVGTVLIMYAKKQQSMWPALAGIALCADTYLVSSIAMEWVVAAAILGGLYAATRQG